jgi:outer membrane receptor protein involved in Fe transport
VAAAVAVGAPVSAQDSAASPTIADTLGRASIDSGPLARVISIRLDRVPLAEALEAVALRASLKLSFSSDLLPADAEVTVDRSRAATGDVLRDMLRGTGLTVAVTPGGYVVVVRAASGLEPSGASSSFAAAGVPNADLARTIVAPRLIDRVVVMGTAASEAPEAGLASAITVVTAEQIARRGARTLDAVLRTSVPGLVIWDLGAAGPVAQIGAVRGSSSFGSNYLKAYIDGVELASPYLLTVIDPASVERLEIIRGPQGSALYGSDAISGVAQVVSRRGRLASGWKPRLDLSVAGGAMSSSFTDSPASVQDYTADAHAGGRRLSYLVGATYRRDGAIVEQGGSNRLALMSTFRVLGGSTRADVTVRHAELAYTTAPNPLLATRRSIDPALGDTARESNLRHQTVGLTLEHQPSARWQQTLMLGFDRNSGGFVTPRVPGSVADGLLGATHERASRASARYSTAVRSSSVTLPLEISLGAELSRLTRERLGGREAVDGASRGLMALYVDSVDNAGVFGQGKLAIADRVHLTAGLRAEHNSSFGDRFGTAWSPMVGAVVTREVGTLTVKLRGAYGKGIRPPPPSARLTLATTRFRQLPNVAIAPESQSGVEGGLELFAGDRASLRGTVYSQRAHGLVQTVMFESGTTPISMQQQNIGRIANDGVELEGYTLFGFGRIDGTWARTSSRVRRLARTYTGDLRVGDRMPDVPSWSGSLAISTSYARMTLTAGTVAVGPWSGHDWLAYARAGTTRPLRDYRRTYDGIVRPYALITREFPAGWSLFGQVENIGNSQRNERDNTRITAGRTVLIGARLHR